MEEKRSYKICTYNIFQLLKRPSGCRWR